MSLLPFTGMPHSGAATFNNSLEIALPAAGLRPFGDVRWSGGGGNVYVQAQANRIYIYSTPISYRVQSLTGPSTFISLSASGSGSGDLDKGLALRGANWYAMRSDGNIERFSFTGTYQQKLSTGLGAAANTVRLGDAGGIVFYQDDNTIFWNELSTNGDLTTAGTQQSQTFSGFASSSSFDFNGDGSKLYIADGTNDEIREYSLSTNYDPSTAGSVTRYDYVSLTSGGAYAVGVTGDLAGLAIDNVGKALVIGSSGLADEMVGIDIT